MQFWKHATSTPTSCYGGAPSANCRVRLRTGPKSLLVLDLTILARRRNAPGSNHDLKPQQRLTTIAACCYLNFVWTSSSLTFVVPSAAVSVVFRFNAGGRF